MTIATSREIEDEDDIHSNSAMSIDEPTNSTIRSLKSEDQAMASSSSESVIPSDIIAPSATVPIPVPVPVPIVSGIFPGVSDEVWVALPFEMQTELLVSIGMQAEADALLDAEITATGMYHYDMSFTITC